MTPSGSGDRALPPGPPGSSPSPRLEEVAGPASGSAGLDADAVDPRADPLTDEPFERSAAGDAVPAPPQEASLAQQARRGLAWSGGSRLLGQVLQFGSSIVLARLLTPRDFGLVATVYIFTGLASLLTDMGIGSAIVRKPHLRREDLATAFWTNAIIGVAFTLVVGLTGPVLADLYDAPELVPLLWLAGLNFSISLHLVPLALLERSMQFGRLARTEVVAFTLGAASAMTAAFAGLGFYSLIVSPLVQSFVLTVLLLWTTRFRPQGFIERRAAAELWAYTRGYTGANILSYLRANADGFVVGRVLGQAPLGYYGRAMVLVSLPLTQITYVLHRVMLPTLSRLREDRPRLLKAYASSLSTICVVASSGMALLTAMADVLVPFIWGTQWLPVIPIVQWLAVSGALMALAVPNGWLCEVEGRTGLLMRLTVLTSTVTVVGVAVGVQYGVVGVAVSLAVTSALNLAPALMVSTRLLKTGRLSLVRQLLPGFAVGAVVAIGAEAAQQAIGARPAVVVLGVQAGAAGLLVLATVPLLDRLAGTGIMAAVRALLERPRTV